jgi:SAM-dependent methyltransferase
VNAGEYAAMYRVEDRLWWYTGMRRIAEGVLGERLRGQGRRNGRLRVLDAGCGTGGNLQWLEGFGEAHGVDLSPHAVAFCARRRLPRVSRASVLALPFADESFDLVTSFDVIYHLDVSDDVAALREMCRVVRRGGWALVRVPAIEALRSEHDAAVHTRQRYTLPELRNKMARAGFTLERGTYANCTLFPVAAAARLASRWRGRTTPGEHRSDVRPAPAVVNAALSAVLGLEAAAIAHSDLPFGLSAVAVGRRAESRSADGTADGPGAAAAGAANGLVPVQQTASTKAA